MFDFSRLPEELIPCLLEPLQLYRRDLYNVCLVSRAFAASGRKVLYSWIRLFGRDLAIAPLLFQTLNEHEHLCELVRRLEIRVFPLSFVLKERIEMEELAAKVIRQCVNVRHLVWTRKGSLTDRVLDAIVTLKHLETVEINASTALKPGSWSADKLLDLASLTSISLILPDRVVANLLPRLLERQCTQVKRPRLKHLTVLGRESVVLHDALFRECIPHLVSTQLESLALAGCIKLSGAPLLDLVSSLPSLRNLALEATAVSPSFFEQASSCLVQLRSIKLTHPGPRSPTVAQFYDALSLFLANKRALTSFTLYFSGTSNSNGPREWPTIPPTIVTSLMSSCPSLTRFEVSGVLISRSTLEQMACTRPGWQETLTDLVVHFGNDFDVDSFAACTHQFVKLRTVHVLSQRAADIGPDDLLPLVDRCRLHDLLRLNPAERVAGQCRADGSELQQIGFRNRVWIVRRSFVVTTVTPDPASDQPTPDPSNEKRRLDGPDKQTVIKTKVSLDRWDSPFWPEALLVVRT